MTAAPEGPSENALYELLPTVFRQRDIAQGYPLLALTKVFDHIRDRLAGDISDLERDWFIATCPLDYVPLIGALLGVEIAKPVRPEHRALVADTLAFRRRKGTASALPKLIRDSAGWYSIYSPGPETPASTWPLADVVTPIILRLALLRVWRLPVFAVIDGSPSVVSGTPYYNFNPLGMDQPLFNVPNTPLDWVAAAPVTALPVPLTMAMLKDDLARYTAVWPDTQGPPNSLLYGPARGLVIRIQKDQSSPWIAMRPDQIRPTSIAGDQPLAPDYPVLQGGSIKLAAIKATTAKLSITFGDASAALSVDIPAKPTMSDLVKLLQAAIENSTIHSGVQVTAAAVKALKVGAVGNMLVIVPTMSAAQPLFIAPVGGGPNPLQLETSARPGLAAATLPLTPQLIGLLTGAPAGAMIFTAPAGQVLRVQLPLELGAKVPTPAAVAAAFALALPTCFVCDAGDQVVIVPPPAPPAPPVAATAPALALGLVPAVAIDPELGRLAFPFALAGGALSVDYGMAMPGAIGGIGWRSPPRLPPNPVLLDDGGSPGWLQAQLAVWAQSKAPCTELMLQGSVTRRIASQQLAPASGQSLWIVGAAGSQPCVVTSTSGTLTLSLRGPDSSAISGPGAIGMSGLTLEASITFVSGAVDLTLLDTTLYPGAAPSVLAVPPPPDPPPTPPAPPLLPVVATIDLQRCVLGPIDLTRAASGSIKIDSSVLSALPQPDVSLQVLTMPDTVSAEFSRLTLIGGASAAGTLRASDSLFDGVLACSGDVYLNHCYVRDLQHPPVAEGDAAAPSAIVTRCATCGKARSVRLTQCMVWQLALTSDDLCSCEDASNTEPRDCATCTDLVCAQACPLRASGQLWVPIKRPPNFDEPNRYPLPNFARLSSDNSKKILTGAGNRDVLGSYNLAVPSARFTEFEAALRSALLPGVQLDRKFET